MAYRTRSVKLNVIHEQEILNDLIKFTRAVDSDEPEACFIVRVRTLSILSIEDTPTDWAIKYRWCWVRLGDAINFSFVDKNGLTRIAGTAEDLENAIIAAEES